MEIKELLKKVRKIELKSKKIVNSIFLGEYHSIFKGRGIEFNEVREYQYGDDVRLIDWNVTAKMDKPYIKVNQEEREITVYLVVDLSASMKFSAYGQPKIEILAEISAIFALSAIGDNDKIGLIIISDKVKKFVKASKGKTHALRIIRDILEFGDDSAGQTNLAEALLFFNRIQKRKSIMILISDFYSESFSKELKYLSIKHQIIPIIIRDRMEKELIQIPVMRLKDLENKTESTFFNSSVTIKSYHSDFHKRELALSQIFT